MTTPTHDTTSPTREEVARSLAKSQGYDPDDEWDTPGNPTWTAFTQDAEAILALFAPALAAAEKRGMEKAMDIYGIM